MAYGYGHDELRESGEEAAEAHCAVLYRTNSQSRLVEEALRRYNIRYTMVGGFSFYERAEIKDLLSYLRLVRNPHDSMALQRVINTPTRGIGKTTLETLERVALETGQSTWDAMAAAIANRLIPTRALMALESFRQLIVDAQAMMDPDFAGKLSADVAESAADAGDTDFAFGSESPTESQRQQVEQALEGADDFSFGANENQMPLLDASHFSPFAEAPKRPFLRMPKQVREAEAQISNMSSPQDPTVGAGRELPPTADPHQEAEGRGSAFRKPGDAATLPELIRFLIDRTGYIKALEAEASPEAFSRIENLKAARLPLVGDRHQLRHSRDALPLRARVGFADFCRRPSQRARADPADAGEWLELTSYPQKLGSDFLYGWTAIECDYSPQMLSARPIYDLRPIYD